MKCVICGDTPEPGRVTVTLERGSTTIVFRGVPAMVCPQCNEQFLDGDVTGVLLDVVDAQAKAGVQVEVREYKAAA